jgi:hypothetical protein
MTDKIYDPFKAMSFTNGRCFLCGHKLRSKKTVEHVFPKWLQNKYKLQNQELYLLNETGIPYRQLTIPCCSLCNSKYLSKVEDTIKQYSEKGYTEFVKLDRLVIYQWIAKIYYGLLFKELSLPYDRTNLKEGNILDSEFLGQLKVLHIFLQSIRIPFNFTGFHPWSIFIVETHSYGDERDFDYHDEIFTLTFSIRMGDIGVIACLEDNGAQESLFSNYFNKFKGIKLLDIQFDELVAKVCYQQHLLNRVPKYMMMRPEKEDGVTVAAMPLQGFSIKPIYDNWVQRDYAAYLAFKWARYGITLKDVYKEESDLVFSNLIKPDGTVNELDADGTPIV